MSLARPMVSRASQCSERNFLLAVAQGHDRGLASWQDRQHDETVVLVCAQLRDVTATERLDDLRNRPAVSHDQSWTRRIRRLADTRDQLVDAGGLFDDFNRAARLARGWLGRLASAKRLCGVEVVNAGI